jgi:hypothetical protein
MTQSNVSRRLVLLFINVGVLLGMVVGYVNYRVDKYSLFAIGIVSLLVLNGMFFAIRACEPSLPQARLKQMNTWVVWPIVLLAGLILINEVFCGKR